jgi:DNA-binding GntR family transcriptional regulator
MVLDPSQIRSRFDVPEGPVRSFLSSLKGKL